MPNDRDQGRSIVVPPSAWVSQVAQQYYHVARKLPNGSRGSRSSCRQANQPTTSPRSLPHRTLDAIFGTRVRTAAGCWGQYRAVFIDTTSTLSTTLVHIDFSLNKTIAHGLIAWHCDAHGIPGLVIGRVVCIETPLTKHSPCAARLRAAPNRSRPSGLHFDKHDRDGKPALPWPYPNALHRPAWNFPSVALQHDTNGQAATVVGELPEN